VLPADQLPLIVDPAQGWLANWNNKPIAGWQNSADGFWQWGPVHRAQVLTELLRAIRPHTASIATLERINRTVGQTSETPVADDASVIVQRLLPALRGQLQLSADPRLAPVAALLARWNQQLVDNNGDGRYDDPAVTIFTAWYGNFAAGIIIPVLGADYGLGRIDQNTTANVALRLLEPGSAALPLTADYLRGTALSTAVTGSLVAALDQLTTDYQTGDVTAWLTSAATSNWSPLGAGAVPDTPLMNRGTYNQIISLGPTVNGENVVAPGQSGDVRSPHFADQLSLYATWTYKPMRVTDRDIRHHAVAVEDIPVIG
jgi:penicillin amidase